MERILVVALVLVLFFGPIALIGWGCVRVFRNRNVWLEDSVELPWPAPDSAGFALTALTPRMQKLQYRLSSQGPGAFVFTKKYRPVWLIVPCLLLFPIGLLSLLYARTVDVSFSLRPQAGGGSHVAFSGKGPPYLRGEIGASLAALGEFQLERPTDG